MGRGERYGTLMIRLSIAFNNSHLKTYELEDTGITVGRLPENTISIANMGMSRRHFRIDVDSDRNYVMTDLNSLNGVMINDVKLKTAILRDGDVISIGKYAITFSVVPVAAVSSPRITDTDLSFPAEPGDPRLETVVSAMHNGGDDVPDGETLEQGSVPVLIETGKHVVYKLDKKYLSIGSAESDDVFVSGFMVGDEHAVLENQDGEYWIRSTRLMGKFKVNGKKTGMHRLEHKDRIEIGGSTFRFMINQ